MTEDPRMRIVGETGPEALTGPNAGEVLPDAGEVKVNNTEMQELGEFLEALRTIVLGQEQRISYIEAFLASVFGSGNEEEVNEVEGDGLPEVDEANAEPVSGADDTPGSSPDSPDEDGNGVPSG